MSGLSIKSAVSGMYICSMTRELCSTRRVASAVQGEDCAV